MPLIKRLRELAQDSFNQTEISNGEIKSIYLTGSEFITSVLAQEIAKLETSIPLYTFKKCGAAVAEGALSMKLNCPVEFQKNNVKLIHNRQDAPYAEFLDKRGLMK